MEGTGKQVSKLWKNIIPVTCSEMSACFARVFYDSQLNIFPSFMWSIYSFHWVTLYFTSINTFMFYLPNALQLYIFFVFWLLAALAMLSLGSSWSHTCLLLYKMYCFQFCHTHKLMRNSGTLTLMNTYESNLVRIYPVCCCIASFHQSDLCVYVYAYANFSG
jgi:hypothetical protein